MQHPVTLHKVQLISELVNNENTLTIRPTETHLNEKTLDSEIQMKNYIGFRADRTLRRKNGGVITYIKATEAVDAEQLIAKSNSYVEYQLIHMKKRNSVIINVFRPPDGQTEKFISPMNELRTKLLEIGNPMPNIIFTGDLNFPTIDWQMETADGGTYENQVQANAFLQFAQEQCLQQYIEEPTRKNNILDVFLTNNDQLTRQIIITETSMSDHNIIQIKTNITIVEEKQNNQIKKSTLRDRDLNFFNEDISWASIDADLLNTSWDMLLTDVETDEMYKIIINICQEICKKLVLPKKSP